VVRERTEPGRWGRISRTQIELGQWRARARYRSVTGVAKLVESSASTAAGAERALVAKLERLRDEEMLGGSGDITPATLMTDVFDQWIEEKRAGGQVVPQSLAKYVETLEFNLRPAYGALRVREMTPVAVNRVLMALSKAGKFDTARQCRNVMSQVMMMCVRYGAAPFNPVRDAVTVRKPKKHDIRTIDLESIAILRKAVRTWEERPAVRGVRNVTMLPQIVDTMLGTGLRIGECLALRVSDLDLDAEVPTLTVTGTVVRAEGRLFRQPNPKSDTSERTIALPALVVTALREAIALGLDGGPDDLVFPSKVGTPRSPSRVREQLKQAQEGTGLDVRPHDFRRTVGTQVANNTTLTSASMLLGHADEATTRAHYVKRIRIAPDVREVIDQLFSTTVTAPAGGAKTMGK